MTFELSIEERAILLSAIYEKQFRINSEIADINPINEQWARDEVLKMEEKMRLLRILAIKMEG